jgi:hypothetical protein
MSKADFSANLPTVWLENYNANGMDRIPWLQCLAITDNLGEKPSTARIKFAPASYNGANVVPADHDYSNSAHPGPTALAILYHDNKQLQAGQRVVITEGYNASSPVLFMGMLMNRLDTSDPDCAAYECVDDKWLISGQGGISIRGALVSAGNLTIAENQSIQYCTTFLPVFNPDGNYNCIGVNAPNIFGTGNILVPMFAPHAQKPKTWNTDYAPALSAGNLTAWTPRLALKYLCYILQIPNDYDFLGVIGNETWRTINPANYAARLTWNYAELDTYHAYDSQSGSGIDLLDKWLNELTIQDKKALLAVCDVLRALGTHTLATDYEFDPDADPEDMGYGKIIFLQKAWKDNITLSADIAIPQSGTVESMYDYAAYGSNVCAMFSVSDSAEDAAEAVVVDGDAVRLEANFLYDPANQAWPDSQIIPAWSGAEETAFKTIINGGPENMTTTSANFAVYPPSPANLTYDNAWLLADPTITGREFGKARSPSSIAIARKLFPKVFRAFRIYPTTIQTAGYNNAFSDAKYPDLHIARPIQEKQEQTVVQISGTSGYESTIIQEIPARIRIQAQDDDGVLKWFDTYCDAKIDVDNGGIVWIDGIQDEIDKQKECIYTGTLMHNPFFCTLKKFTINAVVKMDHRVYGYYDNSSSANIFSSSLRDVMGGPPMMYINSGKSFKEVHQVASNPSAFNSYQTDTGITSPGTLTRVLPPTTGRDHANMAAKRRAFWASRVKRNGRWVLPGIRTQYYAGIWIDNIVIFGNPAQTGYYIGAPIQSVTWDFAKQETELGGLIQDDQQ